MYKYPVDFKLLTENGNQLTEYSHNSKMYVEGRKNSAYKLKIQNTQYQDIEVLISVDGLDIIDGNPATTSKSGYLIKGYQSVIIDGWRISDQEVRKFLFSNQKESYSNKTGQGTSNVGVIGFKCYYPEYIPSVIRAVPNQYIPWTIRRDGNGITGTFTGGYVPQHGSGVPYGQYQLSSVNATTRGAVSKTATVSLESTNDSWQGDMGTGMGHSVSSKITYENFKRGILASEGEIFYATKRALEKMGVITVAIKQPQSFPRAFCREV